MCVFGTETWPGGKNQILRILVAWVNSLWGREFWIKSGEPPIFDNSKNRDWLYIYIYIDDSLLNGTVLHDWLAPVHLWYQFFNVFQTSTFAWQIVFNPCEVVMKPISKMFREVQTQASIWFML